MILSWMVCRYPTGRQKIKEITWQEMDFKGDYVEPRLLPLRPSGKTGHFQSFARFLPLMGRRSSVFLKSILLRV
jgi:hypothetical protein